MRDIDRKRLDLMHEIATVDPEAEHRWYLHSILTQCFLPYRDQQGRMDWDKQNGRCGLILTAGAVKSPSGKLVRVGLPFGTKPRLFQSYINTLAIKQKSPVIPVERSMTAMMRTLGFAVTGGKRGTIASFKEQTMRYAASHFRLYWIRDDESVPHADFHPFKRFDVFFANHPDQGTLWPSEIVLTDDFYSSLREHAVPFDVRSLSHISNSARAQDIMIWMTQRLCRIRGDKPLFLSWSALFEMFGGDIKSQRNFPAHFRRDLMAARTGYPEARVEEDKTRKGFVFRYSPPPIPRTLLPVDKPVQG